MHGLGINTALTWLNRSHASLWVDSNQVFDQMSPHVAAGFGYFAAAGAAAFVSLRLSPGRADLESRGGRARRRFWAMSAAIFLLAGADRLLGLLAIVAELARAAFGAMALYEHRGPWQVGAMMLCGIVLLLIGAGGVARTRRLAATRRLQWRDVGAAAATLVLLAWAFCRAISWHEFEVLLTTTVASIQVNDLVEWTLLAAFIGFAIWTLHWRRAQRGAVNPALLASS